MRNKREILSLGSDGTLVLKSGDESRPFSVANPGTAYLLIDCSGSMAGERKLSDALDGALDFACDAINKCYRVGLATFATDVVNRVSPTSDLQMIRAGVTDLVPSGRTNMTSAIRMATDRLAETPGPRAIVLVTDGVPDDRETAIKAAGEASRCDIDLIAIGTADADERFLAAIASASELAVRVRPEKLGGAVAAAAKLLPPIDT